MSYESAWLNDAIRSGLADVHGIDNVYICIEGSLSDADRLIIDTAANEMCNTSEAVFGSRPGIKRTSSLIEEYTTSDNNANVIFAINDNFADKTDGAFIISVHNSNIYIKAGTARGILYGTFRAIFNMKTCSKLSDIACSESPASPLRILNHWDNIDGSIERGYSGNSFFFEDGEVIANDRTETYARLIASVGINATVINNVNVRDGATLLIGHKYRSKVGKLAAIFAKYGIRLFLSLNFAAPIEMGGLATCDPNDENVKAWWKNTMDDLFGDIPELGGFLIKADSEGRPGPFTYDRTHADGANMLADAVAPYGALIIWRCFVYNCKQDWRDTVTDRAKAQYDNFIELDGQFRDNVILQIKNGPMDFQVREPVSPLFGGLHHTNEIIEFQIAQEYTGQQKHVCYLIPEFKETLAFKTYMRDDAGKAIADDTVADVVTGRTFGNVNCGMAAVANTGNDDNWTGHDLAAANLFGFGRLSFNPDLTSDEIAGEWIKLTFGNNNIIFHNILFILNSSWPAYEKYNAPLGVGWMVNPGYHYGPNVDGYEFSEWGTYHRSDSQGMGVERSSSGTDYVHQYNEPVASLYENIETCPDELLLFMHHVPYTHRLKSGSTVIQHIYDSHYEGAQIAKQMRGKWLELEGKVEPKIFGRTLARFDEQVRSAEEWRDTICTYYRNKSGIPDEKGRI